MQSRIECSVTFGSNDWRVEVTDSTSLDNRKYLLVRLGFSLTPYMTTLYFRLAFELWMIDGTYSLLEVPVVI